ncbi:MAG TPA: zinc ribbon domain-containing protein [Terriglobia bacterium]|nr:zinc ribbon domain-containing protein [Terriglobia bacterium]
MPADSGHLGRERKEKVVELRRSGAVAEIEEMLSEARRLFSLHDYQSCDKMAREILGKDPQNSKAKALLDLATINLTNPKRTPRTEATHASETSSDPAQDKDPRRQPLLEKPDVEDAIASWNPISRHEQELHDSVDPTEVATSSPTEFPSAEASSDPISQKNSLRERTISALVDLFQRRDLSLADWKDPRFQTNAQPVAEQKARGKTEPSLEDSSGKAHLPLTPDSPLGPRGGQDSLRVPEPGSVPEENIESAPNTGLPAKPSYQQLVARKFEERSEDLRKSEIRTISIAQIKKYLYQEDYQLCAQELENIRKVFPDNSEIQVFVENTFRRLTELQRIKNLENQSRELMSKATTLYKEGKLPEALNSANEALQLVPNHQQAKEFVTFVHKRIEKENKKTSTGKKPRYCWYCGVVVDSIGRFCFHCGQRLT